MLEKYWLIEERLIAKLATFDYTSDFIHDKISGRITLYLLLIGFIALINELYITIDMSLIQKETYNELNTGKIDESLKLHRMLISDEYHGKEYLDAKSGIVIEEFESRDKFFAKPVHVSQLFVDAMVTVDGKPVLEEPLHYHIEFSPEEYELEKRPEFGCNLKVLRVKLYHLFKDSQMYHEFASDKFTISKSVEIYNKQGELLPTTVDDVQLCFLKIETEDVITCNFIL